MLNFIGIYAFYNCIGLESINVPDDDSFWFHVGGKNSNEFFFLGTSAFGQYTNLKFIIIPSSINYINNSVFINCNELS